MDATSIRSPLRHDAAEVRAELAQAGGYLRNVIRAPGVTCRVCATPIRGYDRCWRCWQDRRIRGLADVVAPLSYAIADAPSGALLREYKNHPARTVRQRHSRIIKWLLFLAIRGHERCIGVAVGHPVSMRLAIPSLTGRRGVHPFLEIVETINVVSQGAQLVPAPTAVCDRVISSGKFALQPAVGLDGRHVLVLDDIWTTGSNAQSAALTLRRAGASAVSVLTIGRWLGSNVHYTNDFTNTRLTKRYDPRVCPVTGGRCP